ncbi:hypothetical protein GGX14DRAFT_397283 [Mycena pura]|uniref:Uncharacterized protein n=1 Tax=Mycena pura TaxID=153505 RepID=A0AAD6YER3_9AGAR|nr:hypothetical protein GGX14DRAFT_397283 [Mycena pura]
MCENLGVRYPAKDREDIFWHRTVSQRFAEWSSGRTCRRSCNHRAGRLSRYPLPPAPLPVTPPTALPATRFCLLHCLAACPALSWPPTLPPSITRWGKWRGGGVGGGGWQTGAAGWRGRREQRAGGGVRGGAAGSSAGGRGDEHGDCGVHVVAGDRSSDVDGIT